MAYKEKLYRRVERDSRRGDETNVYTLHFSDSDGFYIIHYREKDIVKTSGGDFMEVNERETEREMSIPEFLNDAPGKAKDKFRRLVSRMFTADPS